MPREFDRFDATTIGSGLVATDGGLLLTTNAAALSVSRAARGTIFKSSGSQGVEFTFYGDASLIASIGLMQSTVSLAAAVGTTADSVGWQLDTGEIRLGGTVVASGLAAVTKGQIVGVVFYDGPGFTYFADFYLANAIVATVNLPAGASWTFAVSLASTVAGDLTAALNAGQWPVRSTAAYLGWRPDAAGSTTVRICDTHWLSANSDDQPNTRYEGRIADTGIEMLQSVGFWPWQDAVSPRGGSAQLNVYDPDGLLDPLSIDGEVRVRIRQADDDGTLATATDVGRFILDGIEVASDDWKRLRLRDAHDDLDDPLNTGVFLPNITQLAWQPQPVVIGAVCSVPLLAANSDGSVGFLADSPLADVSAVLDRGDALEAGTWSIAPGAQQLLLESPPLGPVVADVSSIAATMTPATLQQALHQVFSRVRKSSWSSTDAAAIDSATGYSGIGYYVGGTVLSARQARDTMLASYCGACWQDSSGVLRFTRLIDPDTASVDIELPQAVMSEDLTWVHDNAPNLTRRMGYRPNAAPMSASDFVADLVDVPMSRRVELMQPYRGTVYSAVPLHSRYSAADRRPVFPSLHYDRANAQAEIDRVCGLYSVERRFYSVRIVGDSSTAPRPGQIALVTYDRYGLSAGRKMLIVSVQRNPCTGRLSLRLWGA
ncbi:MAG: hypothetical protein ABL934_09915 [Lysobacteraceae bacterium]